MTQTTEELEEEVAGVLGPGGDQLVVPPVEGQEVGEGEGAGEERVEALEEGEGHGGQSGQLREEGRVEGGGVEDGDGVGGVGEGRVGLNGGQGGRRVDGGNRR